MSNSITDMQLFFMRLHENDHTFSCKNTDQLSSLWAAFTKCKRNIRDGFRLENMSWRLWSRQALMYKKRMESETAIVLPEITTAATTCQQASSSASSITSVDYTNDTTLNCNELTASRLVRTRSLPSLSCQVQHIMDSCQTPVSPLSTVDQIQPWAATDEPTKECSVPTMIASSSMPPKRSKFYIYQDDDNDSTHDFEESDVESLYNHDDGDYFDDDTDMGLSCYSSDTTSSSSYPSMDGDNTNKPISLLTNLLQKDTTISELRRSNCCERLDLWFSGALSS